MDPNSRRAWLFYDLVTVAYIVTLLALVLIYLRCTGAVVIFEDGSWLIPAWHLNGCLPLAICNL